MADAKSEGIVHDLRSHVFEPDLEGDIDCRNPFDVDTLDLLISIDTSNITNQAYRSPKAVFMSRMRKRFGPDKLKTPKLSSLWWPPSSISLRSRLMQSRHWTNSRDRKAQNFGSKSPICQGAFTKRHYGEAWLPMARLSTWPCALLRAMVKKPPTTQTLAPRQSALSRCTTTRRSLASCPGL